MKTPLRWSDAESTTAAKVSRQRRTLVASEVAASPGVERVPTVEFDMPSVVIVAPVPAVTADDVTIELRGRSLRFWAHVRSAAPRDYYLHEWDYGGYERELELPAGYGSGLEASLGSGQLAIRVLRGEAPAGTITAQPAPS